MVTKLDGAAVQAGLFLVVALTGMYCCLRTIRGDGAAWMKNSAWISLVLMGASLLGSVLLVLLAAVFVSEGS